MGCTISDLSSGNGAINALKTFGAVKDVVNAFIPAFIAVPTIKASVAFLVFSKVLLILTVICFIGIHTNGGGIVMSIMVFTLYYNLNCSSSFTF